MNQFPEKDLLGYVVGALDAQEQRELQVAIDADSKIEDQLLEIKQTLMPLDCLDFHGSRPGLARRTCELVANIGLPPLRRLDPTKLEMLDRPSQQRHANVLSVLKEVLQTPAPLAEPPQSVVPSESFFGVSAPQSSTIIATPNFTQSAQLAAPTIRMSSETTPLAQPAPPVYAAPRRSSFFSSSPISPLESRRGHWRASHFSPVEMAVTAGILMILAGLLFPAIAFTRHQSRLTHCQNNLRQIGDRLIAYSELNHGRFVEIPRYGPLAVAGVVGPTLKDRGLIEDDSLFACAGLASTPDLAPVRIPTISAIQEAIGDRLFWLQRSMSGHYGYTLGYQTQDGYQAPIYFGRSNVLLMSDTPSVGGPSRISQNHGGQGQNCLFEDGHVAYVVGDWIGDDLIFVNEYNIVAPGCHPEDNVIAPSHFSPMFALTQ